jgi:DNA-binding transcriptional MocR family regulator
VSLAAVLAVLYGPAPAGSRNVGAVTVFRVLQAIADDADDDARGYYPARSLEALARDLDLVKRDVQNAVRALVDQGRIVKVAEAIPRASGAVYDLIVDRPLVRGSRTNSYGGSAQTRTGDPPPNSYGDPAPLVGDSYGDPPAHPFIPFTPPIVPPADAEPDPTPLEREDLERISSNRVRAITERNAPLAVEAPRPGADVVRLTGRRKRPPHKPEASCG